jgi:type I restriction enzyme R subunit
MNNSPNLASEIMNAVMDALSAHTTMSTQALDLEKVRSGLKDVLLGPAKLYESLRHLGKRGRNSLNGSLGRKLF